ncbi:PaaI family thioesterase [Promicromonospora aerolata]|uniref:PaaI family thioesterase n=1 Tax=Promicromonospora aerolata TaxID=195749 RepID=A0ABW4VFU2_9MICO
MTTPTTEGLPELLDVDDIKAEPGSAVATMVVHAKHLAPNGLVHAASVVALADTACGYGCLASLPAGRSGFATADLTAHYVGSAQVGDTLTVIATMRHGGSTTQLWDATVSQLQHDESCDIATFRCLQILLSPKTPSPTQH